MQEKGDRVSCECECVFNHVYLVQSMLTLTNTHNRAYEGRLKLLSFESFVCFSLLRKIMLLGLAVQGQFPPPLTTHTHTHACTYAHTHTHMHILPPNMVVCVAQTLV